MNQSQPMVEPTQEDREAAEKLFATTHAPNGTPYNYRPAGRARIYAEAFARHRIAAEARTRAAEDRGRELEAQSAELGRQLVNQQLTELARQKEIQAMLRDMARLTREN